MKIFHNLKLIAISMLLAVGLSACDKPGPAETVGKNIDQTVEKAGDKIDDAADKVEDSMSDKKK
jgi:hyperosmotically inducible protein